MEHDISHIKDIGDIMNIFFNSRIYTNQSFVNALFGKQQKTTRSQDAGCSGTRDTLTISASGKEKLVKNTKGRTHNTNVDGEKYIFIKISAYHKMTVVHIENSCGNVKWKKRMPVSDKGKGRGIGLLNVKQSIDKYDGNLQLKQDGNKFVADLFLNS